MLGQQGVGDLRLDGVLVADDAVEQPLTRAQSANQIVAHLVADGARMVAGGLEFLERAGTGHRDDTPGAGDARPLGVGTR